MSQKFANGISLRYLLNFQLLPAVVLTAYLKLHEVNTVREINAAVVNISGRQRMLSQRTAMLALRLICASDTAERDTLRSSLLAELDLIEKSHNALIIGDPEMKLPGHLSAVVEAMYFKPPLHLDQQIRQYIAEARALVKGTDAELTQDNPHLRYLIKAASEDLIQALDAVVSQYQKESDSEQLALDIYQAELYERSCEATAAAQAQAAQLAQALHELQEAQTQLIQQEKMSSLGQLLAGVAHEINNPVSFIYGNLKYAIDYVHNLLELLDLYEEYYPEPNLLLQDKILDIELDFLKEDLPKVMTSMAMGAERICKIVNSLRNFSRTDEESMQLVNIHEGIDGTLLILQNRLRNHKSSLKIEVIKEYGSIPLVECYSGQMNQVFMNILSNAIDALEQIPSKQSLGKEHQSGSSHQPFSIYNYPLPKIIIHTEVTSANTVTLRIRDNGSGMTEDVKAQLFEPFFTTKPVGKGTGLGLSISHQIVVEKHKGVLSCTSEPGHGTEFCIEIPIRQSQKVSAGSQLKSLQVS